MRMLPVCVCALHLHAPYAACRGGVFGEEGHEFLPYLAKYHRGDATREDVRRAEVFLARAHERLTGQRARRRPRKPVVPRRAPFPA